MFPASRRPGSRPPRKRFSSNIKLSHCWISTSISTFKYSKALKSKTDKWDNNNLDLFLKNPKKWAPGTKMSYTGIKKGEDRANLIKYLQSLK